ncbi:MAG: hypothetical protein RIQ94_2478, partial [Pseudomonadota bacterium]
MTPLYSIVQIVNFFEKLDLLTTWIQVINAISEFMQLCVQLVQKTPHEVFGNLIL